MNNITVIIPVHKIDEAIFTLLDKAIESVTKQLEVVELPKIIIVAPPEISGEIYERYKNTSLDYISLENGGNTNFQSQINHALDYVHTEYFSVLEFDDEYSLTYFKNVDKYITSYPEVDIFLTLMIEINEKNEGIKLTNETVWSQQFAGENGEMGYMNIGGLKQYSDFKLSGAIIKKSEFINIGKYKTKIELSFGYELLLRALNNACKIYTIPKLGYKHFATRPDSMFDNYLNKMSVPERKFWFDIAMKESMFVNDRDIDISNLHIAE